MQRLLFFVFLLLACSQAFCTKIHYRFNEDTEQAPDFTDSLGFLIDQEALFTIDDILGFSGTQFIPLGENTVLSAPVVLWSSIQLTNESKKQLDSYFRLFTYIDSIWMYTFQDNELIDVAFSGNALHPWEKNLSTNQNNLPFTLYAGETKTYYFKLQLNQIICSNNCVSRLKVIPRNVLDKQKISMNTLQAFYAGVMLLFGFVSIFMYILFRESVFIWFALMMFSFTAYFISLYGLSELLFNYNPIGLKRFDVVIAVSCILLSTTLFITRYTDLKARSIKFFQIYFSFASLAVAFPHISRLFINDWELIAKTSDFLTTIWALISMTVIVLFFDKKDKSSVTLLVSVIVLFFGAILFILSLSGIIPSSLGIDHAFQIGTVLFSGVLFYGMFDKINTIRAEKERFKELDQVKSRFFANISHEFRTPLTLVMGPVKDVLENTAAPEDRKRLELAYQNAERLLQLINQLLDLSKLEANKMELWAVKQNLPAMLKGIAMSFESLAKRKNIQLNFVAQKEAIPLYVDKDKVEKIFYNLLSNAFKFTEENGEIAVMITDQKDQVEVLVRDNGVGIPPTRLANIFNRFFQGDYTNEQEGSGIGLALVKELVQLHKGKIEVASQLGKGTTFTVTFLKGKAHLAPHEIYSEQELPSALASSSKTGINPAVLASKAVKTMLDDYDEEPESEAPVVLIIEDNAAVRDYIKQHLIASFQIVEAINGQEGIDKALELLPDLIISDVMMPQKDGYEVCASLKTDERTSHIPIILLTAKAAAEEKLKGLETGADDYLVKPFDTKELGVRARNLIESRRLLRKKFSNSDTIEPQTAGTNAVDKAFLAKVCASVEIHLSDEQFGVEFLAREIGLSRSQLNRKLKALTDQSPNKFIQSFRLQKAKELLLSGAGNVSEIALQTGFNSTAYFVKCFGDKYGQTPGSLLQE